MSTDDDVDFSSDTFDGEQFFVYIWFTPKGEETGEDKEWWQENEEQESESQYAVMWYSDLNVMLMFFSRASLSSF